MSLALDISHVSMVYETGTGYVPALDDISFSVEAGNSWPYWGRVAVARARSWR